MPKLGIFFRYFPDDWRENCQHYCRFCLREKTGGSFIIHPPWGNNHTQNIIPKETTVRFPQFDTLQFINYFIQFA